MTKRKRVADEPGAAVAQEKPKRKKTARPEKAVSCFERHVETVWRALKKSRGFERQRLYKRIAEQTKKTKKQAHGKVPAREKRKPKAGHLNGISSTVTDGVDQREMADAKVARFEREIKVLRTLDLLVTARVHLARVLLRHRALAEAFGPLTAHLQKSTEAKSTRGRTGSENGGSEDGASDTEPEEDDEAARKQRADDIHNITSALNNRAFVKQAVLKATQEICGLLGIETPRQAAKKERQLAGAKKDGKVPEEDNKEEQDDNDDDGNADEDFLDKDIIVSDGEDDKEQAVSGAVSKEKGKPKKKQASLKDNGEDDDDAALERELEQDMAKFDALLGGSSDEDSDDDDDKDDKKNASRARYLSILGANAGPKKAEASKEDGKDSESDVELGNSESGSESGSASDSDNDGDSNSDSDRISVSGGESDSDAEESSDDEALRPPPKRSAKTAAGKAGKAGKALPGTSHFLPTLMGGYISDGADSDDDGDNSGHDDEDHEAVAARLLGGPRKNRRGQRARQAIWEKKYKQEARHLREAEKKQQQKKLKQGGSSSKKDGWDAKRGAVDASDAPRWMRRKMGNFSKTGPVAAAAGAAAGAADAAAKPKPKKDDSGPLHPSWEAAKKAKEKALTAPFEGKKIVFE